MTKPTAAQRRKAVKVAEDVLKHIRGMCIIQGQFVGARNYDLAADKKLSQKKKAAELQKAKNCRVCALGACLLSTVKFYNKFQIFTPEFERVVDEDRLFPRLKEVFTPAQMILIEQAFEEGNGYFSTGGHLADGNWNVQTQFGDGLTSTLAADEDFQTALANAVEFGNRYPRYNDHSRRLRAIMKNIIKNNGEFIPPKPKPVKLSPAA